MFGLNLLMNGPIFTFLVLRGDTGVLVPGALGYQVLPPAALQGSAVAHVTALWWRLGGGTLNQSWAACWRENINNNQSRYAFLYLYLSTY